MLPGMFSDSILPKDQGHALFSKPYYMGLIQLKNGDT